MRATRASSIATVLAIFAIAGGSTTAAQEKPSVPDGDPCQLLTDAEVRQVLPDAKSGQRERNDKNGDLSFVACKWSSPGGTLYVQIFNRKPNVSLETTIGLYTMNFITIPDFELARTVRLETVNNVGERALAAVEQADAQRHLQDGAVLVFDRGQRTIFIVAPQLARRGRAPALKALEELGRAAAKRP
jgi:hypothetical protein